MPTKKIGSAGRFGSRYGRKIRKNIADIEKIQRAYHNCPHCRKKAVKRVSMGIWACRSCDKKMTGEAYRPVGDAMKKVHQAIARGAE